MENQKAQSHLLSAFPLTIYNGAWIALWVLYWLALKVKWRYRITAASTIVTFAHIGRYRNLIWNNICLKDTESGGIWAYCQICIFNHLCLSSRLTKEIIDCEQDRFYFTPNGMPAWRSGVDTPLLSLYRNSTPPWIPPSCSYLPDATLGYHQANNPSDGDDRSALSYPPEGCSDDDNTLILDGLNNLLVALLEYYRNKPVILNGQDAFVFLLMQLRSGGQHPNISPILLPVCNTTNESDISCCAMDEESSCSHS